MKNNFERLSYSFDLLRGDRVIMFFSLIPVLIGMALFYFFSAWVYGDAMAWGKQWIESYISSGGLSSFFYYILVGIMTAFLFFLLSWTFVLVVSLIASPFNDLISERVERKVLGKEMESISDSFKSLINRFFFTIINEFKKIIFIIILTILSLIIGIIPVVGPIISIVFAGLLLAIQFLDYNWSRNQLPLKKCISDIKNTPFSYIISGIIFLFLMSIPILNLLALPLAVVYFSVLFSDKIKKKTVVL